MSVTWSMSSGNLGTYPERISLNIPLQATSDTGTISFSVIAGSLPRGLRVENAAIVGSPTEVRKYTENKFVIRASDGIDVEDRTFTISIDGADLPVWVTTEGFLNVGLGEAYYVLDNARVDFQLEAYDSDEISGDVLEYYLVPNGGELPPGLSLSKEGTISGFTDPIFAVEYAGNSTGTYDTASYDITPLDVPQAESNGFDSYLYDTTTYDYNESVRVPRRLSRPYAFVIAVSDGINEVRRLFRIWVVTEEFLKADNSIVQVDTNLFRADASAFRVPLWITPSNLGRHRANNYLTIRLDVYDPIELPGTIIYFKKDVNPDTSVSEFPPGLELDTITGDLSGRIPYQSAITDTYQFTMRAVNFPVDLSYDAYSLSNSWDSTIEYTVNQAVVYLDDIYICVQRHRNVIPEDGDYWRLGTASAEKTFTIDIIGELESTIEWISDEFIGSIKPNQPSRLFVEARNIATESTVFYQLDSGVLPPGLQLLATGDIVGKVKQFGDSAGPGLTRFYYAFNDTPDSTGGISYDVIFDNDATTFDRKFFITIEARDSIGFAVVPKNFYITVISDDQTVFSNLYLKAFQSKEKRLEWYNFITDNNIFARDEIYRYGDLNFGVQTELKVLVFAGIESVSAVEYVQAMSRNHYNKQLKFGDVKKALGKNPTTQEIIYEVIYVEVVDDLEINGKSISSVVNLPDDINSPVLISYDAIKVDSDIPFVSDRDHQRIFPNSIKNMRSRIKSLGKRDREYLPLWMRSTQENAPVEIGYTKALVLCYAKPGYADKIMSKIKFSEFDFKDIDFTADRYLIDIIEGEVEYKYLAFPQRGEKLP